MKRVLTTMLASVALITSAAAESLEKGYISATGGIDLYANSPDLEMSDFLLQINDSNGISQNTNETDVEDLTFTLEEQQNRDHLLPSINMHAAPTETGVPTSWTLSYTFTNTSNDEVYYVQNLRLNLYAMHQEADGELHPINGEITANVQPGYIYKDGTGSLTSVDCKIVGTGDDGVVGGTSVIKLPTGFTLKPMESITLFVNVTGTSFYHEAECQLYIGIEGFELSGKVVPVAVPEPATATLSLLALAGLLARRRRK